MRTDLIERARAISAVGRSRGRISALIDELADEVERLEEVWGDIRGTAAELDLLRWVEAAHRRADAFTLAEWHEKWAALRLRDTALAELARLREGR